MLTREYILSLEAGRELDALVAEKVMGWERSESWGGAYWVEGGERSSRAQTATWRPSSDISAAWEVVEKFYYSDIRKLNGCNWGAWVGRGDGHSRSVTSVTAPEAICKAALLTTIQGEDKNA